MKKVTAAIVISLAAFCFPSGARADEYTAIQPTAAAATSTFFAQSSGVYQGTFLDVGGVSKVIVEATCTANCPASVTINVQVKAILADDFSTACQIVNPDVATAGLFQCLGPGAGYMTITTSNYVSGTYKVTVRTMK